MVSGSRLGIDFGTSHTVAVVRWDDGRTRALLFEGSPLLPSAVFAEPGEADLAERADGLTVGRDALDSARSAPARLEPNPKRRIDEQELLLGERVVPLGDAVTAVLRRVVAEHFRTVGGPPDEVTLTCPANWGATRRFVLEDAARAAGIPAVRLVAEPVAAATYFVLGLGHHVPVGAAVVVYDFGAGTFDASVVANAGDGFSVLAVDGLDTVGGLDLDELTLQLVGAQCPPGDWQRLTRPSSPAERRAAYDVREQARTAKERLSRAASVTVHVPLLEIDVIVTREELQEKAKPLLDQTIRVTNSVIRFARLTPDQVAGVFLVGGASRMPLIATLLHQTFGRAPIVLEQPELVVAEGSVLVPDSNTMPSNTMPSSSAPASAPAPTAPTAPAAPTVTPSVTPTVAPSVLLPLSPPAPAPAPVAAPRSPATFPAPQRTAPQRTPDTAVSQGYPTSPVSPGYPTEPVSLGYPISPVSPVSPAYPTSPGAPSGPIDADRSAQLSSAGPPARPPLPTPTGSTLPRNRPVVIVSAVVVLALAAVYSMVLAFIASSIGSVVVAIVPTGFALSSLVAAIGVARAQRGARLLVYVLCGLTAVNFLFIPIVSLSLPLMVAAVVLVSVPSSRSWLKRP